MDWYWKSYPREKDYMKPVKHVKIDQKLKSAFSLGRLKREGNNLVS